MPGSDLPELGALEPVGLRSVWPHEAHDFTPWLAKNLDKLATILEVSLDLEGTEVYVGRYKADIVARIPQDGTVVLIENQLEEANLQHLGQVLAYLAGLDAKVVVWIAKGFDETHLSSIRWLNEHTADPFAFFAVGLEVVRIGDSKPAPVFHVLERPNEWQRRVHEVVGTGDLSELGRFRRDFWAHFAEQISDAPGLRPGYRDSNVWHPVKNTDVAIVLYLAAESVGLYLSTKRGVFSDDAKAQVENFRTKLPEDLLNDRILKIDTHDRSNWDRMADWLDSRRRDWAEALETPPDTTDA